jgi:hypothetical protein
MLGCDDAGFADIQATALSAAIAGSILAAPDACFVMRMTLQFWLYPRIAHGPRH